MTYLMLSGAILLEILGTTLMARSDGFARLWFSLGTVASYLLAFVLLAQTLKSMEVGTAYAIWSGAGTAVIAAIGIFAMGEPATALRIGSIALIIAGVIGLNLGGAAH
jgi:small multidrug resistance pump